MIVIAGGGISGLSAAYFLQKQNKEYVVLEQSAEAGGCIQSFNHQNCLLEAGPNSLLCSQYLENLIEELDLTTAVLPASKVNKNRFIFKKGKYRKLPSNPLNLLVG